MRVRALDIDHDWQFGKGQNDYLRDQKAVMQSIKTRLMEFLNDCFFNTGAGIDWFNLLGSKNQTALNLAISSVILNTPNVTGLRQLNVQLSVARNLSVSYVVQTTYSTGTETITINPV